VGYRPLPAEAVIRFVNERYESHADFARWRGGQTLTPERAVLVGLCLHGNMSQNAAQQTVFGNKGGAYREAALTVKAHYHQLERLWKAAQRKAK